MGAMVVSVGRSDVHEVEDVARVFKALGDPNRVRMVQMVTAAGEVCVRDFTAALNLSQSTISHHFKLLVDAGLLLREQRGTWGFYRLSEAVAEKTDLRAVFNMQEA